MPQSDLAVCLVQTRRPADYLWRPSQIPSANPVWSRSCSPCWRTRCHWSHIWIGVGCSGTRSSTAVALTHSCWSGCAVGIYRFWDLDKLPVWSPLHRRPGWKLRHRPVWWHDRQSSPDWSLWCFDLGCDHNDNRSTRSHPSKAFLPACRRPKSPQPLVRFVWSPAWSVANTVFGHTGVDPKSEWFGRDCKLDRPWRPDPWLSPMKMNSTGNRYTNLTTLCSSWPYP